MTTREALHALVDTLPEDLLAEAEDSLERLAAERAERELAWRIHDEAPLQDQELSEQELEALRRLDAGASKPMLLTEAQMAALPGGAGRG